MQRRPAITSLQDISQLRADQVGPTRRALQEAIAALVAQVQDDVQQEGRASTRTATGAIVVVCVLGTLSVISAVAIAMRLSRQLRREVGSAVGNIRSSSAELESAADLQVSGGRDQVSAMNEITTTRPGR